ncbi:MAG: hypothetical protein HQK91_07525 [Nitrospirae bacterium]|nr:hypothetical protein [Nitrospirota bacterium]
MKIKIAVQFLVLITSLFLMSLAVGAADAPKKTAPINKEGIPKFFVPSPPFTEGIYPCSNCHAGLDVNTKPRVLKDEHTNIVFKHAEKQRWCLDCHNASDRDVLHLTDGRLIPFTESYALCGQCHGEIYRDWKVGLHGKRTGMWNGEKMYRLCVNCHNPHDPKFKELKPEPAPLRPSENGQIQSSTINHE